MKTVKDLFKTIFVLIAFSSFSAFADVKIVSPAVEHSKVWANKQVLVINATEGEEVFYSFTTTDPLRNGFAYDEPVLIDMTGDVKVHITSVNKKRQRTDYVLKFTVDESLADKLVSFEEREFVRNFNENPILNLDCGKELEIPSEFDYSISCVTDDTSLEAGRGIYVSPESTLDRYVSLTLKSKSDNYWNYVIHVSPVVKGEFTKSPVPFEIEDWSKIKLIDNKFIYCIDDGWWQRSGQEFEIDRSVNHTIKWQSVDYDPFNPVESYEIPATPVIHCVTMPDSTIEITLEGDESYRFAKNKRSSSFIAPGLHNKITVDAFQGENFSTLLAVDVYSENVYQGQLYASVQVNRKRPQPPQIVLSDTRKVCRDDVSFRIEPADEEHNVQYFISKHPILNFEQITGYMSLDIKEKIPVSAYEKYNGSELNLTAEDDVPAYYKVYAYSIDKWDNVSSLSVCDVIIDKCNYFINPKSSSENSDGTFANPFKDLSEVEEIANSRNVSNFYIYGRVNMKEQNLSIKRTCHFTGVKDAQLILDDNSAIYVMAGTLTFNDMVVKSVASESDNKSVLFSVTDGALFINNCEISFGRNKSSVIVNAVKSSVDIKDSSLSSYSNDYAAIIASNKAKVNVRHCRLSTVAATNVCVSAKSSTLGLFESNCTVNGINGRIIELFNSKANIELNSFNAKNIQTNAKNETVWKDEKSKVSELKNNHSGF